VLGGRRGRGRPPGRRAGGAAGPAPPGAPGGPGAPGRAAAGGRAARVDVSGFVGELPTGADTADLSTDNASGSTSQAAAIVEALEVGAGLLLIDEDTAATNLMVRDRRMQEVISADREPLTPFVDVVRSLHHDHGVSTVLVAGGSGDYFDVADVVVAMDAFRPREVTATARAVAERLPGRRPETSTFPVVRERVPDPGSVDARRADRVRTRPRGTDALGFGRETIDLSALEQLVDPSQTAGIASALLRLTDRGHLDGETTLAAALDALDAAIADGGTDLLRGGYPGAVARPPPVEVAAALNPLPALALTRLA
jgi:predicted ABC-class ATPase